jgi:hypothetical protein
VIANFAVRVFPLVSVAEHATTLRPILNRLPDFASAGHWDRTVYLVYRVDDVDDADALRASWGRPPRQVWSRSYSRRGVQRDNTRRYTTMECR